MADNHGVSDIFEQMVTSVKVAIKEVVECEDANKEIEVPNPLSPSQLEYVLCKLKVIPEVQVIKKWSKNKFHPKISNIVVKKKKMSKQILQNSQNDNAVRRVFPVRLCLPAQISALALKLTQVRWKRTSPFHHRSAIGSAGGDQGGSHFGSSNSSSNFSIMTYLNTQPVVPSKAAKLLFQQQQVELPTTSNTSSSSGSTPFFDAWARLLQKVGPAGQLHVLWGLSKTDKLNLAILLNNEAYSERRPCRIIYLQSLSILTFWMAFTVKGLCEDYHWDCSGYQITLENKTSPRNNIMFFELATFICALNRDINTSLVTHLIVDIDGSGGQQHFFSLFLLYLKENFASQLRHMRILIFATDAEHAVSLQQYYADTSEIQVNLIDFQSAAFFGGEHQRKQAVQIANLYLDDMANFRNTAVLVKQQAERTRKTLSLASGSSQEKSADEHNEEMERLMGAIHAGKIDLKFMLDFISAFPVLINYQCHSMGGITPLILTVLHGRVEEVARVLAIGADARLASWEHFGGGGNGLEPLEWALNSRREDVFQLLFAHCYATSEAFDLHLEQHYAGRFFAISSWPPVEVSVLKSGPSSSFFSSTLAVTRPSGNFKSAQQGHSSHGPSPQRQSHQVNYQLVLHLLGGMIRQIKGSTPVGAPLGAILILLPSYNSISTLRKLLIGELSATAEHQFTVFCLYPHLPNNELEIVIGFLATEQRTQVRIILSTLMLDSLLLADVRYVLNAGVLLKKVQSVHCSPSGCHRLLANGTASLVTAASECAQYDALFDHRSPKVYFYNLFWKGDFSSQQQQQQQPKTTEDDIYQGSSSATYEGDCIYQCIFALESLNLRGKQQKERQSIRSLFMKMVSHPPMAIVDRTVQYLKELNILNDEEHFTDLGRILINLSIEPQYAKMIIYSVLLRCLDPILTIVCALSSPQCFELTDGHPETRHRQMKQLKKLSHGSFSDHLTLVYAFQKWQEQTRANPETVERSVSAEETGGSSGGLPILFSSFELIYSLRTKILGQLRACGFVKGKGALNIRSLNANSTNFALVKAAITAGSSLSQLAQLKQDAGAGGALVTSDAADFLNVAEEGARQPVTTTTFLHPNSILAYYLNKMSNSLGGIGSISSSSRSAANSINGNGNSFTTINSSNGSSSLAHLKANLILYDRKVRCGSTAYIEHCTLVSPLTVAIFGNEAKPGTVRLVPAANSPVGTSYMLFSSNSGTTEVRISGTEAARCFDLRARWQQFAAKRLANINGTINEEEGNLIGDILSLVGLADESIGFGPANQHANIGKAPQVMSTYFCSTKMVMPARATGATAKGSSATPAASTSSIFSTIKSF